MPLRGPGHLKENVRTLIGEVGKSPHVQSREQALAIAYAKERGRQTGGLVPRRSEAPGPEDAAHLIDIMPKGPSVVGTMERLHEGRKRALEIPRRQTGGLFAPPPEQALPGGVPSAATLPTSMFPAINTPLPNPIGAAPGITPPAGPSALSETSFSLFPNIMGPGYAPNLGPRPAGTPGLRMRPASGLGWVRAHGGLVDQPGAYAVGGLGAPQMNALNRESVFGARAMRAEPGARLIHSSVAGRTDRIPMNVRAGSYVIPADVVSGLGQGNTTAGAKMWGEMLSHATGPYGVTGPKLGRARPMALPRINIPRMPSLRLPGASSRSKGLFQEGGKVPVAGNDDDTPILTAGGELVIDPEVVEMLGSGDIEAGRELLDQSVVSMRKQFAEIMKKLPGPVQ